MISPTTPGTTAIVLVLGLVLVLGRFVAELIEPVLTKKKHWTVAGREPDKSGPRQQVRATLEHEHEREHD